METKPNKSRVLVGLFVAAALTVSSGCSQTTSGNANECWDDNDDGYCDDDGSRVGSSYYISNGKKRYYKSGSGYMSGSSYKPSSGVSSGTSSKGGIGSSSGSSSS